MRLTKLTILVCSILFCSVSTLATEIKDKKIVKKEQITKIKGELGSKTEQLSTQSGSTAPAPKPKPKPDCEEGLDPDCDEDDDEDDDRDTDDFQGSNTPAQTQTSN